MGYIYIHICTWCIYMPFIYEYKNTRIEKWKILKDRCCSHARECVIAM